MPTGASASPEYRKVLNGQQFDRNYDDIINNEIIPPVYKDVGAGNAATAGGANRSQMYPGLSPYLTPPSRGGQSDHFAFTKRKGFVNISNTELKLGIFEGRMDVEIQDYYVGFSDVPGTAPHYCLIKDSVTNKVYFLIEGEIHITSDFIETTDYKIYTSTHVKGKPVEHRAPGDFTLQGPKDKYSFAVYEGIYAQGQARQFDVYDINGAAVQGVAPVGTIPGTPKPQYIQQMEGRRYIWTEDFISNNGNQDEQAGMYMYLFENPGMARDFPYAELQKNQEKVQLGSYIGSATADVIIPNNIRRSVGGGQVLYMGSQDVTTDETPLVKSMGATFGGPYSDAIRWHVMSPWEVEPINCRGMMFPQYGDIISVNMTYNIWNVHYIPEETVPYGAGVQTRNHNEIVILPISQPFGGMSTYGDLCVANPLSMPHTWDETILGKAQSGTGIQNISSCFHDRRFYIQTKGALLVSSNGLNNTYFPSGNIIGGGGSSQSRFTAGYGLTHNETTFHLVSYNSMVLCLGSKSIRCIRASEEVEVNNDGVRSAKQNFGLFMCVDFIGIHNKKAFCIYNDGLYILSSGRKFLSVDIKPNQTGSGFTVDTKDQGININKYLSVDSDYVRNPVTSSNYGWQSNVHRYFTVHIDDKEINVISHTKPIFRGVDILEGRGEYRTDIYKFDFRYLGWHTWSTLLPIRWIQTFRREMSRQVGSHYGESVVKMYYGYGNGWVYEKEMFHYDSIVAFQPSYRDKMTAFVSFGYNQVINWFCYQDDQTSLRMHKMIKLVLGTDDQDLSNVTHNGIQKKAPLYFSPRTMWGLEYFRNGVIETKGGNFMSLVNSKFTQGDFNPVPDNDLEGIWDSSIVYPVHGRTINPGDCFNNWQYGRLAPSGVYTHVKIPTSFICNIMKVTLGGFSVTPLIPPTLLELDENFFTFMGYVTEAHILATYVTGTQNTLSNKTIHNMLDASEGDNSLIVGSSQSIGSGGGEDISRRTFKFGSGYNQIGELEHNP